ncbi:melanocortin receptor 4 [Nematostella vectensis]|uniref:melanocortin receptor 4 n=1 Tax=Nematostella vectensis TaxID=45351 RepID=UPI00138FE4CD|nr:melanocortin receptor 4 [Nematostella vectensis]
MDNETACYPFSRSEYMAIQVIFVIGRVCIVVANSLALRIFLGKKLRLKKSKYLLVNLTVADLLMGLGGLVHKAVIHDLRVLNSTWELLLTSVCFMFVTHSSMVSLCLIALERAFAIFFPFRHRQTTRRSYIVAIASTWLISMISLVLVNVFMVYFHVLDIDLFIVPFSLEIGLIVISYVAIWIKRVFFTPMSSSRRNRGEDKKLSKTLFIVVAVSVVTWAPCTTLNFFFKAHECGESRSTYIIMYCSYFLLLSNSFLNVIVYSLRMPEFRKALKELVCRKKQLELRDPLRQVKVTTRERVVISVTPLSYVKKLSAP